ncbi:hypothetical protein [Ideonella sp. YS5]|uniref:hypothetical protein n=1 Tax=Ideonella sp. YS5 TaxID=3453714 RepID=UPI003EE85864
MFSSTDPLPLRLVNAWIVAALVVAAMAGLGTLGQQHRQAEPREAWSELYRDTPAERCLARGIQRFEDAGEWPATQAGGSARALIDQACALDAAAFAPGPAPVASSEPAPAGVALVR